LSFFTAFVKIGGKPGRVAESAPWLSLEVSIPECTLSVDRRASLFHRAFFEHFGFHSMKKIS
jgi:hypothetical protein